MLDRPLPLLLLAAGAIAGGLVTRGAFGVHRCETARRETFRAPHRFVAQRSAPSLGIRRGDVLRVEPEALIRPGDVVALLPERAEVVLTRFHDELMHCTAGRVVPEGAPVDARGCEG